MLQQKELGLIKLNIEYRDNISELCVFNENGTKLKTFNDEQAKILFAVLLGQEGVEIAYDETE